MQSTQLIARNVNRTLTLRSAAAAAADDDDDDDDDDSDVYDSNDPFN